MHYAGLPNEPLLYYQYFLRKYFGASLYYICNRKNLWYRLLRKLHKKLIKKYFVNRLCYSKNGLFGELWFGCIYTVVWLINYPHVPAKYSLVMMLPICRSQRNGTRSVWTLPLMYRRQASMDGAKGQINWSASVTNHTFTILS